MEIIKSSIGANLYQSKIFKEYYGGLPTSVIDIETTGLSPAYSKLILGGMLTYKEGKPQLVQYFANEEGDEKKLLEALANSLSENHLLISYNGRAFDLPFIKYRLEKHKIDLDLDLIQSFDLYRILNKYSNLREILPNLRQKTIEKFLGLSPMRKDEISGAESVELYKDFLKTKSHEAKDKILLHNKDDLIQLSSIMKVLDKLDLHRIGFHEGFTVSHGNKRIILKGISLKDNSIKLTGRSHNIKHDYYSFEEAYQGIHLAKDKTFTISLPYETAKAASFIDLEDFGINFEELEDYPAFENGFLIIGENGKLNYGEINKFLKILISEILRSHML